ncbi:HXXEE domain-containing protein [Lactiplantibacillus daowaiensis]|uniref:HXXEE domain-containing protein n=1 Tax=Lactiplantibacillus daowaiensis TaxID=2559918 RepID=A0ABW1S2F0_9LACO
MTIFRNYWFRFGGGLLVLSALGLAISHPQLTRIQWLLILNFMALLGHQLEEYQFPGGAPLVINRVIYDEHELTDRYPGNMQSIMIVNTSAWVVYVLAIALAEVYWLGLGVILFSLFQILGHVVQMNLKLHTWYNPGMATTILLFLPIGIDYSRFVIVHGLVTGWSWVLAILTLMVCIVLTIMLPVQTLKNKQTPYQIPVWQLKRFEQVCRLCHVGYLK